MKIIAILSALFIGFTSLQITETSANVIRTNFNTYIDDLEFPHLLSTDRNQGSISITGYEKIENGYNVDFLIIRENDTRNIYIGFLDISEFYDNINYSWETPASFASLGGQFLLSDLGGPVEHTITYFIPENAFLWTGVQYNTNHRMFPNYINFYQRQTLNQSIFDNISASITGFIGIIRDLFTHDGNGILGVFTTYDEIDSSYSLNMTGRLSLLGFSLGLVIWGFMFVIKLFRFRE